MSLMPVLTDVGRDALLAAQLGSTTVVLSTVSVGSAARNPTGHEVALTTSFKTAPITSSALLAGQLTLNVQIDGAGLAGDHPVREIGIFDSQARLIFYWSTTGALGALTPDVAYALSFEITLAPADASVIEIIDGGPPFEVLLEARIAALEAAAAGIAAQHAAHRTAAWRNLFLSF